MKRFKAGFTLIEVSLFLALSGALVAGIISGTSHSMARQRYNNAVEEFQDYLSSLYSRVMYTQSSGNGRSQTAIYGKLVVFGKDNANEVYDYTVVGKVLTSQNLRTMEGLTTLQALASEQAVNAGVEATTEEKTELKWNMEIMEKATNGGFNTKQVALLIVRSPISGAVETYSYNYAGGNIENLIDNAATFRKALNEDKFKSEAVDFCLDSEDKWAAGNFSRDIRLNEGARNSAAIEVIADDVEGNKCRS